MDTPDILFKHLGIVINHISRSFSVFGLEIYYYAVIIVCGMTAGILLATKMMKRDGHNPEILLDFAFIGIFCGIIGARLYYVAFSWDYYKNDPLSILNLRMGGLAVFGGVIGGALALIIFTRVKKVSFLYLADYCVFGVIIGQIIGRWGNFFNTEAFGGYTDGLLAMQIKKSLVSPNMISAELAADMLKNPVFIQGTEYIQVHPTFFYESMWNLALLTFMILYSRRKKFCGEMLAVYLMGEGIGRFWIEGLRTDQLIFFQTGFPVSQIISVLMILVAVGYLAVGRYRLRQGSKQA